MNLVSLNLKEVYLKKNIITTIYKTFTNVTELKNLEILRILKILVFKIQY